MEKFWPTHSIFDDGKLIIVTKLDVGEEANGSIWKMLVADPSARLQRMATARFAQKCCRAHRF